MLNVRSSVDGFMMTLLARRNTRMCIYGGKPSMAKRLKDHVAY
jgi:hypothetical protein